MLLFSVLLLALPAGGAKPCPRKCVCYEHSDLVDCRARGFARVPRGFPHGTWLLDLAGNKLPEVRSRAFGGLWSLRILVLSDCGIQLLCNQVFYSLSFLEKLDLSYNELHRLPPDFSQSLGSLRELHLEHNALELLTSPSLEGLEKLEKLDLSNNRIAMLEPSSFRGLSRLRHLYLQANQLELLRDGSMDMMPVLEVLLLGHNNISWMEKEALSPLHSLSLLSLESNQLEHLTFKALQSLRTSVTHLQLAGNPWSCDCDLHRVFSKILSVRHLRVDDYRNVTCHQPPQLAGESLAWVDSQLCMAETVTVLVITITVLVTVMAAVVMAERNRKKNTGRSWEVEYVDK